MHGDDPIPVTMTCGLGEENLANNRAMRDLLAGQGYPVELVEHRDAHNWVSWRDVLEPHLPLLLETPVGVRREIALEGGELIAYGHYGRPLLAFPSEQGPAGQYEERGMIEPIEPLLDAGRIKVYAVQSYDSWTWHDKSVPLEERARRHGHYEDWILNRVVPWIGEDTAGGGELIVTGCSFGAYHAANFCLKRADLFPLAICQSGVYDVSVVGWGDRGDSVYFNNPADYVANLEGDHLDWLRSRASLLLVCGQGQWEDTTGALASTNRFAQVLGEQGNPLRARPLGSRRPARLALLARPARLPPAEVLLMAQHLDRAPARHRGGLADRVRGAGGAGSGRSTTGASGTSW